MKISPANKENSNSNSIRNKQIETRMLLKEFLVNNEKVESE
jgi:hypothetical protein